MDVECKRCGHKWNYKGQGFYATCPRCKTSIKVREIPPRRQ